METFEIHTCSAQFRLRTPIMNMVDLFKINKQISKFYIKDYLEDVNLFFFLIYILYITNLNNKQQKHKQNQNLVNLIFTKFLLKCTFIQLN